MSAYIVDSFACISSSKIRCRFLRRKAHNRPTRFMREQNRSSIFDNGTGGFQRTFDIGLLLWEPDQITGGP